MDILDVKTVHVDCFTRFPPRSCAWVFCVRVNLGIFAYAVDCLLRYIWEQTTGLWNNMLMFKYGQTDGWWANIRPVELWAIFSTSFLWRLDRSQLLLLDTKVLLCSTVLPIRPTNITIEQRLGTPGHSMATLQTIAKMLAPQGTCLIAHQSTPRCHINIILLSCIFCRIIRRFALSLCACVECMLHTHTQKHNVYYFYHIHISYQIHFSTARPSVSTLRLNGFYFCSRIQDKLPDNIRACVCVHHMLPAIDIVTCGSAFAVDKSWSTALPPPILGKLPLWHFVFGKRKRNKKIRVGGWAFACLLGVCKDLIYFRRAARRLTKWDWCSRWVRWVPAAFFPLHISLICGAAVAHPTHLLCTIRNRIYPFARNRAEMLDANWRLRTHCARLFASHTLSLIN